MHHIEAPYDHRLNTEKESSIFLGCGISNCKNWHKKLVGELAFGKFPITVINPRRENFDIAKQEESLIQIKWEHKYLRLVDIIVFYFCEETVCPITLFELGAALERNLNKDNPQRILVYCEPNYIRKFDVGIQTQLINDAVQSNRINNAFVYDSYEDFVENIKVALYSVYNEKNSV